MAGWSPWYTGGINSYFGYTSYAPWGYGWSRYGGWYDPFGYSYGYGYPYGYGYGYGYYPYGYTGYYGPVYSSSRDVDDGRDREYGSLRLRASPREARVYVDGALAGIVDDFDGLTGHLEIEAGIHQLELRADGYEPYTAEVEVEAGRTRTARMSLTRIE